MIYVDPEFNNYIIQQEGKLVEIWYMETFSKFFAQGSESPTSKMLGTFHKYMRTTVLNHFGAESLKEKFILQIEECVNKSLKCMVYGGVRRSETCNFSCKTLILVVLSLYFFIIFYKKKKRFNLRPFSADALKSELLV